MGLKIKADKEFLLYGQNFPDAYAKVWDISIREQEAKLEFQWAIFPERDVAGNYKNRFKESNCRGMVMLDPFDVNETQDFRDIKHYCYDKLKTELDRDGNVIFEDWEDVIE